jgi:hypothetical protein
MCGWVEAGIAIAAVIAAASAKQQGDIAKANAKSQEEMMNYNIEREKTASALRDDDRMRRTQALIGKQRALYGANGQDPNSGSAWDVQGDTWTNSGREGFNEQFRSTGMQDSLGMNASAARMTGDFAGQAGSMNAMGTLLNYGVNYAMIKGMNTTTPPKPAANGGSAVT